MIQLIDPNTTIKVDIEGTFFHVKALNNGQKVTLAQKVQELQDDVDGYNALLELIAPHIEKIEGFEDEDVAGVLINLSSAQSQMQVINAVLSTGELTEADSKNSDSSSKSPVSSQVNSDEDATSAEKASASAGLN